MSNSSADESDGMSMTAGQFVIVPKGNKYTIVEQLGKGGYGAVYLVTNIPGQKFALKAEKKLERREHSKLNMELHILNKMKEQPENSCHYARIFDKAMKSKFYLIVMTLLGESLSDLKKRHRPAVFSLNTGYAVSMQCLEALEELHKIGFVHRDIKPGNYAIGLEDRSHIVYILDFGISRRILNDKDEIKTPRDRVPFKGTVRFAPLITHQNKELGYKDDCESWIYMTADMCNPRGVPWKMEKDKEEVRKAKEQVRSAQGKKRLFIGMAVEEFGRAFDHIISLHYTEKPDYPFIYRMIRKAATDRNLSLNPPFDWDKEQTESATPSTDSSAPSSTK